MKKILITGANGFIGQAVLKSLLDRHKIIVYVRDAIDIKDDKIVLVKGNITDNYRLKMICAKHVPDVVIHCAGIAYQNIGSSMDKKLHDEVNHIATNNLARAAAKSNPNVHFIFLSSTSVYGENYNSKKVEEGYPCMPSTEYARSKLEAEYALEKSFNENLIKKLDILRLAPVYDFSRSLNLGKRVFGPRKLFYVRFGSGDQKISVLALHNLVDFILFRIEKIITQRFINVFNVTDNMPVSFNTIIEIFKNIEHDYSKRVVKAPLCVVWMITQLAGFLMRDKKQLFHSFYKKLSNDLIFSNKRMLDTGFTPEHTVKSVFAK